MKLSVMERVLLGNMMSSYKGDFATLKLIREGREAISFNDEENVSLNFVQNGASLSWNVDAAENIGEAEIEFSETMTKIIKDIILKLNAEKQLTEQHFSLYEKFIQ